MHPDLLSCIETAKQARDGVLDKSLTVKEANAIAGNNHTIVTAHALDLRERMFLADSAGGLPRLPGEQRPPADALAS